MRRIHSTSAYLNARLNLKVNDRAKMYFDGGYSDEICSIVQFLNLTGTSEEQEFTERIMKRRFHLLGHSFDFNGGEISWNLDPVTGKQWPNDFSFDIAFRGPERLSDIKLPWELAKMQYLFILGKAFAVTKDEMYVVEIKSHIDSWITANPPYRGIHWISALESGMRVISWVMVYPFIRNKIDSEFTGRYLTSIFRQAEFIESNLSLSNHPNTHLIGEAFALLLVGMFLISPKSGIWYRKGLAILLEQIRAQVHIDGIHKEQSFAYHRFFLDYYFLLIILLRRNKIKYPAYVDEIVQKMTECLLLSGMPNGSLPSFGDSDDARGIWVKVGCENDHRGILGLGAVLFDRLDFRYGAGHEFEEVLWLGGPKALEDFESKAWSPPSRSFIGYDKAGYYVMRNGFAEASSCLVFDSGPLGWGSAGHGHADALSFQLQSDGFPFLVDPGTYSYNLDYEWRDYFRSTLAHNTVTVDGQNQSQTGDRMSWTTSARAKCNFQLSTTWFDLVEGQHDGYSRLTDPLLHRRIIFFDKKACWMVVDCLESAGLHSFDYHLHLHPNCSVMPDPLNHRYNLSSPENKRLLVQMVDDSGSKRTSSLVEADEQARIGWYSGNYGSKSPARTIRVREENRGNTWFSTFLSGSANIHAVKCEHCDGAISFSIHDPDERRTDSLFYSSSGLQASRAPASMFAGRLLFVRELADEYPLIYGKDFTDLEIDGCVKISSGQPIESVVIGNGVCEITMPEESVVRPMLLETGSNELRINGRTIKSNQRRRFEGDQL